jgi:hypothetical protein
MLAQDIPAKAISEELQSRHAPQAVPACTHERLILAFDSQASD